MCKLYPSRKFVFAIDGSEFCRITFAHVLKLMNPYDMLHLVQIRNPPGGNSFYTEKQWSHELEMRYNALCRSLLSEFTNQASSANVQYMTVELFGNTKEELTRYCSKEDSCILIIGHPAPIPSSRLIVDDSTGGGNYSTLLLGINYQKAKRCLIPAAR